MSDNQQQPIDYATYDVVNDAIRGNMGAVREWLHGDGLYNRKKQVMLLRKAALYGHTDICQLVIDCRNVSTDGLIGALVLACCSGHLSVVQLIVSKLGHYCNSHLLNDCLHLAASHGNTKVGKWLLRLTHPTDVDYMRWDLVQTSARGDLTRVTQLVNKIGRDVTDVMSDALWTACYWGRARIVDWLITHTLADVNYSRVCRIETGNMTPLAVACYEGHMKVVKRLLTNVTLQCEVNMVTDTSCNTALHKVIWYTLTPPLHRSCNRGDTAAVVDVVYECDVNMQDRDGKTAMHIACANGHLDIVKVLLSAFADINITDDAGRTPVAECEYYGSKKLARLIQHKHPMSVSGNRGNHIKITAKREHHNNMGCCNIT